MVDFKAGPFADLKVAGLMADTGACGHYRIKYPLEYLRRGGAQAEILQSFNLNQLFQYDVVIAQRQYDPENYKRLMELRDFGKVVVYELDDNIHHIHPSSHAYATFRPGGPAVQSVDRYVRNLDGLFVTTYELAQEFRSLARRTWVLPNYIDTTVRDWDTRAPRDLRLQGKQVIGWAGSITHQDDWAPLQGSLARVLRKNPQAVFALVSAQRVVEQFVRFLDLPSDQVVVLDPVEFDQYPQLLTQFDVGIAPIVNTPFNRAKSHLKLLEYGAWGIPYVASRVAPYNRLHQESGGAYGYLATTPEEWEQGLQALLNHPAPHTVRDAFRSYVRHEHSYERNIYRWAEALREARDLSWAERKALAAGESADAFRREYALKERPGRNEPCPCGSGQKYKKCACYGSWGL